MTPEPSDPAVSAGPPCSIDGLLAVDKPGGWTSHDVVDAVRRRFGLRKVGHTGTLDPLATGVLLLCLGKATRLSAYVSGLDKCYEATFRLGVRTDTMDADGTVTATAEEVPSSLARVRCALAFFGGEIQQVPPMYSARKVAGRKLYDLARQGKDIPRAARRVTVHALTAVAYKPPDLQVRICCSSGTYVRVLAEDLGARLGCGGHVARLRRTAVGSVDISACSTWSDLEALRSEGGTHALSKIVLDPGAALSHLRALALDEKGLQAFCHGNPVSGTREENPFRDGELVRACAPHGDLAGIGRWVEHRAALHPVRVLLPAGGRRPACR